MLNEATFFLLIILIYSITCLRDIKLKLTNEEENIATRVLNMHKPYNDKNKYYILEFPNNLQAMIIIDKLTKSSGMGLAIKAGGAMDKDIYGLAHFTEHMVFLGSKKFNNATYFFDYVTLHHGKLNGQTSINSTSFFFKIDEDNFKHAFDIFSSAFTNPFFNSTFIEKEINSVNSEHQKNMQLNVRKKNQILKKVSNPKSFFSRFITGNNKTLLEYPKSKNLNLTDIVNSYFNEYYVPNNMRIVLYGSKNINYYKKLLYNSFGKLKEKPVNIPKEKEKPFVLFDQKRFIIYESQTKNKEIDIYFLLPGNDDIKHKLYKRPIHIFFQYIINNAFKNPEFMKP